MLKGRFGDTSGRPYIEARLFLRRLKISGDVSFIVDTGSDVCLLMPLDGLRLRVDYSKLSGNVESVGVGGLTSNFVEPALIVFSEPKRCIYVYDVQLQISSCGTDIMDVPSLLGRQILDRWRMVYNPSKKQLNFKVLSADYTIPLPTS